MTSFIQPIDWKDIETAIHRMVTDELGYEDSNVIWERANVPQPSYPYVSLFRLVGPTKEAGKDEIRSQFDSTQPQGKQIEMLSTGPRAFTLSISSHVDEESGANDPNCNAMFVCSKLQSALGKTSVLDQLAAVEVSVIEELAVTDTSLVVNGKWLSRATLDVRLRTVSNVTERTAWIDEAETTGTISPGAPFTQTIDTTP